MIKILLVLAALGAAWYSIKLFTLYRSTSDYNHLLRAAGTGLLGILLVLIVSGRAGWLAVAAAGVLAALRWLLPLVVQLLPSLLTKMQHAQTSSEKKHENKQEDNHKTPQNRTRMSRQDALAVLGLPANASRDDIVHAHRKLMQRVHPDRGGSEYLAAQLNQARDVLLN